MYEMICNFIYDITKERYMIYNIQVWYTDMIYHITWYVIHTIRCVQFLRHIGLGQTSCSCCKLTFSAAPPRKFFVPAATSADYDLGGTCLGQTSCSYFKLTFWDLLRLRQNVARYNEGQTVDVAQQQRRKHIGNTRLGNCQRTHGYQRHIDLAKPMTIWGFSSRLDAVVEDLFWRRQNVSGAITD